MSRIHNSLRRRATPCWPSAAMSDPPNSPKPGFTTLCRSLHDLLATGKYREVWSVTNDILTRALKLIDPITADFLRDEDDEAASTFLLFHEYLLYSITAPGWALILAFDSQPGEIAVQVFNFFTGAQKISNSLCRTVLANAKGRANLVERTWKVRGMLLEDTRAAVEALWRVDTRAIARSARSPFGREAAMEPWSVLEALVPGGRVLKPKKSVGSLLRGWAEVGDMSAGAGEVVGGIVGEVVVATV